MRTRTVLILTLMLIIFMLIMYGVLDGKDTISGVNTPLDSSGASAGYSF